MPNLEGKDGVSERLNDFQVITRSQEGCKFKYKSENAWRLDAWMIGAVTSSDPKGSPVGGHLRKGTFLGEMGQLLLLVSLPHASGNKIFKYEITTLLTLSFCLPKNNENKNSNMHSDTSFLLTWRLFPFSRSGVWTVFTLFVWGLFGSIPSSGLALRTWFCYSRTPTPVAVADTYQIILRWSFQRRQRLRFRGGPAFSQLGKKQRLSW